MKRIVNVGEERRFRDGPGLESGEQSRRTGRVDIGRIARATWSSAPRPASRGAAIRAGLGERAEAKQVEQQLKTKIVRRENYVQG